MLHKNVCKTCMVTHATNHRWQDSDEHAWNTGVVICPFRLRRSSQIDYAWIIYNPPVFCKYVLEHLILSQDSSTGDKKC